jgi:hypothetical protein
MRWRSGYVKAWVFVVVAVLVVLDLASVRRTEGDRAQVLPRVDTSLLGDATVAIACSACEELAQPAPRDARLSYEQVDAVVRRAIRLDTTPRNLAATVAPGDWVAVKVNIVTMPLVVDGRKQTAFWDKGTPHWGQVTDLRVVKSVIDYLVTEEKDARRITIVEGGAEWDKVGEEGTDPKQTEDGWTVRWTEFDSLSYAEIVETYNGTNGIQVDIVDLNYDDWVGTGGVRAGDPLPVPDPNHTGITWYQRPEGYYVSRTLLEVDKMINLPAMKTHDIPGVTLLHKQYVGTLMQRAYGSYDNSKMNLHQFGNERVPWGFLDLFSYRPTDYGIIEGFWGTEGPGPQWGKNVQLNVVIAGADPVAVDAVGATVMGFNPKDLVFLRLSAAKGFGTYDLDHIRIMGDPIADVQRSFEKTPGNPFWGWGNRQWLVNGPHAAADLETAPVEAEAGLRPAEGDMLNGIAWTKLEATERFAVLPEGYVASQSATYAFAYIQSSAAQDGFLHLGADDGAKVWVNGQQVFAKEKVGTKASAAKVPIFLHAGLNPVLVKVHNAFRSSGLSLVAGDEDGDTLPGIEYMVAPPTITAVTEESAARLPADFALGHSYPNPFNPETSIPYLLPRPVPVKLAVYDVLGRRVRTLVDRVLPGGSHLTRWDGRDDQGQEVASGVYLYRLAAPAVQLTGQMLLVR